MEILTTKKTVFREKKFIDYMSETFKEESVISEIFDLARQANYDIDIFLKEQISKLPDKNACKKIRKWLISQKYDLSLRYEDASVPYISFADDRCALIDYNGSTAILFPDGQVKTNFGVVSINANSATHWSFIAHKMIDGHSTCSGLYSRDGDEIVPCVFDHVETHIGSNDATVRYKDFDFEIYWATDPNSVLLHRASALFRFINGDVIGISAKGHSEGYCPCPGVIIIDHNTPKPEVDENVLKSIEIEVIEIFENHPNFERI